MPNFVQSEMKVIKPDGAIFGSPETLEKLFDDFTKIPKNKIGIILLNHCIQLMLRI